MTTNVDRAAEVIDAELAKDPEVYDTLFGDEHVAISHKLRDARLLTPDLPTPDRDGRWWPTAASIGSVTISPAGEVVLHSGRFRGMTLHLTPAKAADLANILNAAAAHAEQEKK
jgi:hypothetical protein